MELFDKPLKDLTVADLKERLQDGQVREGFFVDYKVKVNDELWKTVSSLANTYGGFVFIGIGEDEKTKLPVSFEGIPCDRGTLEQVRGKVEGNVHPYPPIEIHPVECETGKAIIVVRVFESFATPHVCGNGIIYQRNDDASSPVRDRHDLDRLYEKGDAHRAGRKARLDDSLTRRHIYTSYDWEKQVLEASTDRGRIVKVADHLVVCVLVVPEFIGNDAILPGESEQTSLLRDMDETGETRRLRDGTASISRNDIKRDNHKWNWWGAERISIVYRDGVLEFIKQMSGSSLVDHFSATDFALFLTSHCVIAGRLLKDRLRPGNQTHLEVHILGAKGRRFFDDVVRRRSCECDHGTIRLEYDADLGDESSLRAIAQRAIDDVMSECGGVYREH